MHMRACINRLRLDLGLPAVKRSWGVGCMRHKVCLGSLPDGLLATNDCRPGYSHRIPLLRKQTSETLTRDGGLLSEGPAPVVFPLARRWLMDSPIIRQQLQP